MQRSVARVVESSKTLEGAGFPVRRPFPTRAVSEFDPFLLLDHLGPVDYPPGEAKGAPDHPHRGFETVTYVLEGRMQHKDSRGHAGQLGPGDVQWMTAGAGIVHSEMPEDAFLRSGGRLHGFQLWVNLPARDKMMKPRYQEVPAARIPLGKSADGKVAVRVLAGEALGHKAVIDTRTPIALLHYSIAPGGRTVAGIPKHHAAFAYVFGGRAALGAEGREVREGEAAFFDRAGTEIPIEASVPAEVLVVAGVPLGEPIARYGPFVMNTEAEIAQAFEDFRSGRMGSIGF
jgi:quercetin 2,3-dioxygenase